MKIIAALSLLVFGHSAYACDAKTGQIFACTLDDGARAQLCQMPGAVDLLITDKGKTVTLSTPNATALDTVLSTATGSEHTFYFAAKGARYAVTHMASPVDGTIYGASVLTATKADNERAECRDGSVTFNERAIRAVRNDMGAVSRNLDEMGGMKVD